MALVIIEGLDRTGKSSLAESYKAQGYELLHQSAPPKGQTPDAFLEEMIRLVSSAANRDIVLDRSYYGELVWPLVYGRESLMNDDNLEALREMEDSVGISRILMHDPNVEAHWKRCVDNKEPMTKPQFIKARGLFSAMAEKYGFLRKTFQDFPELAILSPPQKPPATSAPDDSGADHVTVKLTKEQTKLETANAINDVLSKRILKSKGQIYDQLENSLRLYLNNELGKIFGTKTENTIDNQFSKEETELLKFFCKQLKERQK